MCDSVPTPNQESHISRKPIKLFKRFLNKAVALHSLYTFRYPKSRLLSSLLSSTFQGAGFGHPISADLSDQFFLLN